MSKIKQKKTRTAPKRAPGPLDAARDWLARYGTASAAGATVILVATGAIFWVGGYGGRVADAVSNRTEKAAIAAGLDIREVTLRGAHNIAHADILDAIGPVVGTSLAHLDLAAARARIEALGWVRSASVSRLYPGSVHVSIRERAPAAIWQIEHRLKLIDASGAVIREVGAQEYSQLPMIVGNGAPEASSGILTALAEADDIRRMTYAVVRVGERRWNLRLRNGVDVMLPEDDFQGAIGALALLQAANGTLDQDLEYIDLRDPERVVLRRPDSAAPGEGALAGGADRTDGAPR